ncbi:DUF1285 domain-containing protein [Novosphingobium cyanobacteriorum]|uniref:DUF1285 domain-containing protein n=1 Tax=Novosphingobium cyanobacteriorum TaxID=3024215 RepID=A0ABT6CFN1_9SPHN|nr:DUF1285 domain-containing protein [Novosphingobium cyanobacteriorum]MDF8332637.1 DUF1285 domain-containing protein [Novosphingobium cyanobacteriorum]
MPYVPPPELAALSLAELAAEAAARRLPPLDQWTPERTGDSEMRIAADGTWFHQGGRITRPAMVRAFSGLLTRDGAGQHWLVTPFERLAIAVDDAAFIATDMEVRQDEQGRPVIAFRLNTDEIVLLGPDNPLRVAGSADLPAFYLAVRHGVEARLNRSTYGQLIDHALTVSPVEALAVESMGRRFALAPAA